MAVLISQQDEGAFHSVFKTYCFALLFFKHEKIIYLYSCSLRNQWFTKGKNGAENSGGHF
jgi:hypothetical protein